MKALSSFLIIIIISFFFTLSMFHLCSICLFLYFFGPNLNLMLIIFLLYKTWYVFCFSIVVQGSITWWATSLTGQKGTNAHPSGLPFIWTPDSTNDTEQMFSCFIVDGQAKEDWNKIRQFWEELIILIDKFSISSPKYKEKWQKNNYAR